MKEKNRVNKRYKKEEEQVKALCLTAHLGNTIAIDWSVVKKISNKKNYQTVLSKVKN